MAYRRYQLLDRIGVGGMAEVFRADAIGQDGSKSRVVLKRILPELSVEEGFRRMFLDEARIAGQLADPRIVQVLDLGEMDGRLFLALEYVDGANIVQLMKVLKAEGFRVPVPQALWIAHQVLGALDYAHRRADREGRALNIVHRDVSPGNVLVARSGAVKLTDFGIAKASVRATRTVVGVLKGNVYFIAPEQIAGHETDGRADVYGTGMLLYLMLSGRHPFLDDPLPVVLDKTLRGDFPPLRGFEPSVPDSLSRLVGKATRRAVETRFASAADMREAVEVWAHDNGVRLGPEPLAALVRDRLPAPEVGAGPGEEMEATGTDPYDQSSIFARVSLEVTRPRMGEVGVPRTTTEDRTLPNLQVPEVTEITARQPSPPLADTTAPRRFSPPVRLAPSSIFPLHRGSVGALAWCPRRKLGVSGGHDRMVRLWDREGGEVKSFAGHTAAVTSVAASEDGQRVVSAGRDKTLHLWDAAGGRRSTLLSGHGDWIFAVALEPRGTRALTASQDRTLRLWHLERGDSKVLSGHRDVVTSVCLFPDGRRALSGSYDKTVRIWDLDAGEEIDELSGSRDPVRAVALAPDARTAFSGGADDVVHVWELERAQELGILSGHRAPVVALAVSSDGASLLSGSYDGTVRVWDLEAGSERFILDAGSEEVTAVAFGPEGVVFAGTTGGKVVVWEV